MPVMPEKLAGWRIEPPVSVPVAAGSEPRRDRGGRAARRAARHARRVPRVAHRAEGRVLVGRAHRELVAVELAERHRARGLGEARDDGGVERARVAVEHASSRRWWRSSRVTKMSLCAIGTPSSGGRACAPAARFASAACAAWRARRRRRRRGTRRACRPGARAEQVPASTSTLESWSFAASARPSSATPSVCSVGAHSITFGTRNRPSSTAGALRWLASRLFGFGDGVVAQAQLDIADRRQRRVQRLDAGGVDRAHLLDDA